MDATAARDGKYGGKASLLAEGEPLGNWSLEGVKDRRELRATRLLTAGLTTTSQVTISSCRCGFPLTMGEAGRHHMIDWNDSLGFLRAPELGQIRSRWPARFRRRRPPVEPCAADPAPARPERAGLVTGAVARARPGHPAGRPTGWGAAVRPVTIVVATGTAQLRVAADRHWATDVIAGAVLGGTLGYAIPALHIAFADNKDKTAIITPAVSSSYLGLSIAGRFCA